MLSESALRQACIQAELVSEQLVERYRDIAFRIVLDRLLNETSPVPDTTVVTSKQKAARSNTRKKVVRVAEGDDTLGGRILGLKMEGFFSTQRTLAEIKKELAAKGFHYPLTSMSGVLQSLTRQRELRREQVPDGKRKVWKYSNY